MRKQFKDIDIYAGIIRKKTSKGWSTSTSQPVFRRI